MAAHDYLEDLSSLLPAVTLLNKLGYGYLNPSENMALRGGRTSKLILESVLKEQLRKFNSITFKGKQYEFSDGNIQKAVQALTDIPFDSLMNTSEQVYDLLTLGKSQEQTIDGYTKSLSAHGMILSGDTEDFSASASHHTFAVSADCTFTFSDFTVEYPEISSLFDVVGSGTPTITLPQSATIAIDSAKTLSSLDVGQYMMETVSFSPSAYIILVAQVT